MNLATHDTAFRVGQATGRDWRACAAACAEQLGADSSEHALGFLYASDLWAAELDDIVEFLRGRTGIRRWTGASGHGVIAGDREFFGEPALVAMAAELPPGSFAPIGAALPPDMPFGIVHGDARAGDLDALIAESARGDGYLVGGVILPDGGRIGVSRNEGVALTGVALSPDVAVATGLSQGCAPIGPVHEVTNCSDYVVASLDGRPALDVFKEEVGEVLSRRLEQANGYIFAALPVSGSDTGDYLVRNLLGFDAEHGMIGIGAEFQRGDRLMFCRRDRAAAISDLDRMTAILKRRLDRPPRGALYVSCLARGPNLFGADSDEIRQVQKALGPVPLVGFFANGEICHDRLYTYTGVLTLFL